MAASSFGSTNIRVELDAATASSPAFEKQGYTTTRHIPGSDEDVIQVMGAGYGVVALRLLVSDAEWATLTGQLLNSETLTIAGISQGTCLMESLSGPIRHIS